MNAKRYGWQAKLQRDVKQEEIEKATKRWQETNRKIAEHKRSNKPYSEEWKQKMGERD